MNSNLHKPPASALTPAEKVERVKAWHTSRLQSVIGAVMPDGTVFAGTLADGRRLYAAPKSENIAMTFNEAAAHADKANAGKKLGHDNWRVPTKEELALLWENRNQGALKGTFKVRSSLLEQTEGDYWSSTPAPSSTDSIPVNYMKNFVYGDSGRNSTGCQGVVRLVRG